MLVCTYLYRLCGLILLMGYGIIVYCLVCWDTQYSGIHTDKFMVLYKNYVKPSTIAWIKSYESLCFIVFFFWICLYIWQLQLSTYIKSLLIWQIINIPIRRVSMRVAVNTEQAFKLDQDNVYQGFVWKDYLLPNGLLLLGFC